MIAVCLLFSLSLELITVRYRQRQQMTTEVGQHHIIPVLRFRLGGLQYADYVLLFLLIFGLIFPHLFSAYRVSNIVDITPEAKNESFKLLL